MGPCTKDIAAACLLAVVASPAFGQAAFVEHLVSTNAQNASGVAAADVDGDGDTDVVVGEYSETVAWYGNDGGSPPTWTKHVIDVEASGAITVDVADVDRDGDVDVFSANFNLAGVTWYENPGTTSAPWTKRVISSSDTGAWGVRAADIDGDGDVDAVGGLRTGIGVEWYENDGARPPSFASHRVSPVEPDGSFPDAACVDSADVDGDGDQDILAVDVFRDKVLWYSQGPGHPPTWIEHVVTASVDEPFGVFAIDIDDDGDVDVLSASMSDDRVAWHENDGANPPSWVQHVITDAAEEAFSVHAADLDADSDIDVISGTWGGDRVDWYENDGGSPPGFSRHLVGTCDAAQSVKAARVDADSDVDILCAANLSWEVHFFENTCPCANGPCEDDGACNDGIFCNGAETCVRGACQAGSAPCAPPLICRESDDTCVQCLSHADCDDGIFCNGAEACVAGTCGAGSSPCASGQSCDEGGDTCTGGAEAWISFTDSASVPGVGTVADEDIVSLNVATGAWTLVFDGSDVGLASFVIDGMARLPDGSLLLSFDAVGNLAGMSGGPGGVKLDDADIVRFVPTSLGSDTAGSFVFYFDGSDVGLTTNDEDVDAIALDASGRLVISTIGPVTATGATGQDTDLLVFSATSLGSATSGSFSVLFDGSDVGLSDGGDEDVDAAARRPDGTILLSTVGNFAVPGASGADEDVPSFSPTALGSSTSGSFSLLLDLSAFGISPSEDVGSVEWKP